MLDANGAIEFDKTALDAILSTGNAKEPSASADQTKNRRSQSMRKQARLGDSSNTVLQRLPKRRASRVLRNTKDGRRDYQQVKYQLRQQITPTMRAAAAAANGR